VYAAQAPGTGATTIDTAGNSTNGVLSLSCGSAGGSTAQPTLNYITNGDVVAEIQTSVLDDGNANGVESDDPEGAIQLIGGTTADDGLLVAAITGGTADSGNGTQVTYNLTTEAGNADGPGGAGSKAGDTPDAPPSGCLVGGTKVFS
jgi:hypothetical protein